MWISKKEYQEFKDLKDKVNALCKAHNLIVKHNEILKDPWCDGIETYRYYTCNHNNVDLSKAKVNANNYQIRFDEFADYVMQNKPIVRTETVDVEITPKKCKSCFRKNCDKKAGIQNGI